VDCWRSAGLNVVVLQGTGQYVPARVLILHVDLTVIPEPYLLFAQRYPCVVNGRVVDIAKRRVSGTILAREDCYAGPVIVKTDLNCGGMPEFSLLPYDLRGWLIRKIRKKLPWTMTGYLPSSTYPIYADLSKVPRLVWHNPRLVVEKFLPERDGEFYCTRHWLFFGDREVSYRAFSRDPIIKAGNTVHRERGIPIPAQLRTRREQLGFDYGKFDYSLVDGKVVLFDVNRTPTISSKGDTLAGELMPGLWQFLGEDFVPAAGGGKTA
jgi:hypothetical protein